MAVGRAGKKGGPGGGGKVGGASGKGFGAKVDAAAGPKAALAGSVGSTAAAAPNAAVAEIAVDIARMLKAGQIKTKDEATQRLVSEILKQRMKLHSKLLNQQVSEALQDDPRLSETLDRIWSKGE